MHTITDEECIELQRTLLGRLDLDIRSLQKEAASKNDFEQVAKLQHMYDINKSILNKIPVTSITKTNNDIRKGFE